jgi:hypothetical protein
MRAHPPTAYYGGEPALIEQCGMITRQAIAYRRLVVERVDIKRCDFEDCVGADVRCETGLAHECGDLFKRVAKTQAFKVNRQQPFQKWASQSCLELPCGKIEDKWRSRSL